LRRFLKTVNDAVLEKADAYVDRRLNKQNVVKPLRMVRPASLGTRILATSWKALRSSNCSMGDSAKPPTRKMYFKPAYTTHEKTR